MALSRRALLLAAAAAPLPASAAPTTRIVCPLVSEPSVIVPGVSDSHATRLIGSKLYRGLIRLAPDGTPEADLAVGWEAAADGLTHTFHLRPGVTWHDSGGLTAADVAFSLGRFHRALQPGLGLDRLRSVTAPDDRTAVLALSAPVPDLLHLLDGLRLPIVPAHVHDRPGWALDPRRTAPVGTGPFRWTDWLALRRFDWFVGARPALDALDIPVMPDAAARLALLDGLDPALLAADAVSLADLPRLQGRADLAVEGDAFPPASRLAGLLLNPGSPPLDNPAVRLALSGALDRASALREVWLGLGRPYTPEDALMLPPQDARAVAVRFTEAGLRPGADGIRLRLACLLPSGPPWDRFAAWLRAALARVAVEATFEAAAPAEFARRVATAGYQCAVYDAPEDTHADRLPIRDLLRLPLVRPAIPVVHPRRLRLSGGIYGDFATATLA